MLNLIEGDCQMKSFRTTSGDSDSLSIGWGNLIPLQLLLPHLLIDMSPRPEVAPNVAKPPTLESASGHLVGIEGDVDEARMTKTTGKMTDLPGLVL